MSKTFKEKQIEEFNKTFSEVEDTSGMFHIPTYEIWKHDKPYQIDKVNGEKVKDLYAFGSSHVRLKDLESFLLQTIDEVEKNMMEEKVLAKPPKG